MNEIWWPPGTIKYTKDQVSWLLEHLNTIRDGGWPPEYKETGYAGGKKKPHSHSAYYEKPIQVAAELLQRIENCWEDSRLLLLSVAYGDIESTIANGENQDVDKVKRRINQALAYISGRHRKRRSYHDFKWHRKGQQGN